MGILDLVLQSSSSFTPLAALVILLLASFIISYSFSFQGDKREPPGPRPFPLVGNLLQLDLKRPYNTLKMLSKKYGSVFTIYMGPKKVVILAGYKTVKEAFLNYAEEFGEREPVRIVDEYTRNNGILWSNGDSWKEMRRFALANMKDFGMGRRACEDKISEECQKLIEVIKAFKGEAFDTSKPVTYAVSNIICSMVYGSRFEYDDPEFTSLVDRTNQNIRLFASPSVQVYNLYPRFFRWLRNRKEFHRLFDLNIKQHSELFRRLKKTLDPQKPRGIVDAFFIHKQNLEKSMIPNNHFHNDNLTMTMISLFAAGTDTTSATLRWALLVMAKYPKIQDQVREELNRVIGNRQVQVEDRKHLPFTDAVIHEIQRLCVVVPMGLPHRVNQDITFQGYFIKKGTVVYPLLNSVLHDEAEWENPNSFNPAHFLDKDGKFVKREAFLPFLAGRRFCIGEGLARMELFIFFTTLLQHFHFRAAPGTSEDALNLTPHVGSTLSPSPHKLCAVSCT